MDINTRRMLALIRNAVFRSELPESDFSDLSESDWSMILALAERHDLGHLVAESAISLDLLPASLRDAAEKKAFTAAHRYQKSESETEAVARLFSEANIAFILLKGTVLCHYYPEPWMRTRGDTDILVRECDLDRALSLLCDTLGFQLKKKASYDAELFSKHGTPFEIHFRLWSGDGVSPIEIPLLRVFDTAISEGGSRYRMRDDMFYYYHVAHMAKHFLSGGCGVRPFLDLCLLKTRFEDESARKELLAEGGLSAFAEVAEKVAGIWFGGEPETDEETVRETEEFILTGGTYGNVENRVRLRISPEKGGKFRYMLSRIWLPYRVLKKEGSLLEKCPLLLPFYEVARWAQIVFGPRLRTGKKELLATLYTDQGTSERYSRLLKDLGLSDSPNE